MANVKRPAAKTLPQGWRHTSVPAAVGETGAQRHARAVVTADQAARAASAQDRRNRAADARYRAAEAGIPLVCPACDDAGCPGH